MANLFWCNNERYISLHVKYPMCVCVSDFNQICIFLTDFHKKSPSYLTQIHPVGDELIHLDGQTDTAKLIGAACNLC